ncbi:F-box protein CPR1-like [Salvia miltiorrhiza]|uniref:F-box protein CPR1-like n=1 Tax=Salvia miltiorrhiza TaxID=226208 RepID=UPI0025AD0D56|nr:F-box protein CPR1-like [Salvia miltiorrhiza]XP_057793584.1 F-box protein CPR1-like [Salvia miltiorrhiza]XP_057793586.1 F-box protein CPR1-like [Salvia miltiorrhiza]
MTKFARGETSSLLRRAEEEMKLLEEEKKQQQEPKSSPIVVPHLPIDCIFHIIAWLPLESLLASRFVSKAWYGIVNAPDFINAHLQRSSIGLIYLTPDVKSARKVDFSVDGKVLGLDSVSVLHWHLFNPRTRFQIKYLEMGDGKSTIKEYNVTCTGHIKATCHGLIVLENTAKRKGLIVMNPVTREVKTEPLGTICSFQSESYGLAFCEETSRYKLVHLFKDALQYIGCEIMCIGGGTWRIVEGPPHGLMSWLGYPPVSAIGALHWIPHLDQNEHIVSMVVKDEEFVKTPLPKRGGIHDRVIEMDGSLGFVRYRSPIVMEVWILRSLGGGGWAKQQSVMLDWARPMVALFCVRAGGELVFKYGDHLYAYDRRVQLMRKIEATNEWHSSPACYLPHVNTLKSWTNPST